MDPMVILPWQELPQVPSQSVEVLPDLIYLAGDQVASSAPSVPLGHFLSGLPKRKGQGGGAKKPSVAPGKDKDLVLAKYPWLQGHLGKPKKA
eukprot:10069612-Alexandrium_andersonii.AAC.1